jgi:hypothetical protein
MISAGDVVSYVDMCKEEGASLQRGMNFRLGGRHTVILMSRRRGAPYEDRLEEDGRVLVYEGHDAPRSAAVPDPKKIDQPYVGPGGRLTQNGLFFEAAARFKQDGTTPERVRVYEKIKQGIWVYSGTFLLTDAWKQPGTVRTVFRFKLEMDEGDSRLPENESEPPTRRRLIPTAVKLDVWKRDRGRCVLCGSSENLHFDHDIPFSKGGSSMTPRNIRLLCAKHNLAKHDRIE